MAAPEINDALYQQLVETSAALEQPIRGTEDRLPASLSDGLREREQGHLTELHYQKQKIDEAIAALDKCQAALDALQETNWPDQPMLVLPPDLYTEYQGQEADYAASAALIIAEPALATHFEVTEVLEPFEDTHQSATAAPKKRK